jgi:RNA polymerase sigma-B factor
MSDRRMNVNEQPAAGGALEALFASRDDPEARAELVRRFGPFARRLAARFRGRAETEDLEQVAMLALVKAIDRFDPAHGSAFEAFAAVTIVGELKRYLRDTSWAVRVPRRLQEIGLEVSRAVDELTGSLGHSPSVAEVAAHTGFTEDQVLEGLDVATALGADSLDAPLDDAGRGIDPPDTDESFAIYDEWAGVADALRALPERDRRILYLRFFRNLTQSEIAAEIGISQMHVSRLLARSLTQLRQSAG